MITLNNKIMIKIAVCFVVLMLIVSFSARLWIAKRCLEVQVTESFKKSDALDENKSEHVQKI